MIERPHPVDPGRLVCVRASSSSSLARSPRRLGWRSAIDDQGVSAKQIAVFSSADIAPPFSKVGILRIVRRRAVGRYENDFGANVNVQCTTHRGLFAGACVPARCKRDRDTFAVGVGLQIDAMFMYLS